MASVCHGRPSGSSKTRKCVHRSSQWMGAHRKKIPVKFSDGAPGGAGSPTGRTPHERSLVPGVVAPSTFSDSPA